ncbi:MAG: hypothetical protein R2787_12565 [Saprospiraceae bacterium]
MLNRISFRSRIMAMVTKFLAVQLLLYLLTIRYLLFDLLGPYYAVTIIVIKFVASSWPGYPERPSEVLLSPPRRARQWTA